MEILNKLQIPTENGGEPINAEAQIPSSEYRVKEKEANPSLALNTPKGAHSFDENASLTARHPFDSSTYSDVYISKDGGHDVKLRAAGHEITSIHTPRWALSVSTHQAESPFLERHHNCAESSPQSCEPIPDGCSPH